MTDTHLYSNRPGHILLVDDEINILKSMRRMLENNDFEVSIANSGKEALEELSKPTEDKIDVIISDMRMPEMMGDELLAKVSEQWPSVTRILLTGYADIDSTVRAINNGKLDRYITKPWDEDKILLDLHDTLEKKRLLEAQAQMQEKIFKQNRELQKLNKNLDIQVKERTMELEQASLMVQKSYEELKSSHFASIPIFANLLALSEGIKFKRSHANIVAEQCQSFSKSLHLKDDQSLTLYYAGLLHDIGKLGLPHAITRKNVSELSQAEKNELKKHPVLGYQALISLSDFKGVADVIIAHHEKWDGTGFPRGLAGDDIHVGARVLSIVDCYTNLISGNTQDAKKHSPASAIQYMNSSMSGYFDPNMLPRFSKHVVKQSANQTTLINEIVLEIGELSSGMILSQNLINDAGIILVTKGQKLNQELIDKLKILESKESITLSFHINKQ